MADFTEGWLAFWRYAIQGPFWQWVGFYLAFGVLTLGGAMLRILWQSVWR